MSYIQINQEACIRCGACVAVCNNAHVFEKQEDRIEAVAAGNCWRCGHCVAVCPADAIVHGHFPLADCPLPEPLPSLEALVNTFRERRSVRVYKEQPVPREVVRELVDLARWAPSASNKQQVDWLVFDDPQKIALLGAQAVALFALGARVLRSPLVKLILGKQARRLVNSGESMMAQLAQGHDPILFNAPVVLIAHTRRGSPFSRDDAVYAAYNLMLAAQRLNLGTCQIGFFKIALDLSLRLRRSLGLPKGRQAQVILTLGYPRYRFRRALPRRRPDLSWNGDQLA